MPSYISLHAHLYDHLYKDKKYLQESAFVNRIFQGSHPKKGFRLLEIACGTGTHAFHLEKMGYRILAADNSLPMLEVARRKAHQVKSSVRFRALDMRKLPSLSPPFDGAICLFDSLGYALTNEGVLSTLKGIHKNLRKRGLFVFEFWHAAAMISHYEKRRVRKFTIGGDKIVRTSETRLDLAQQIATIKYSIEHTAENGKAQTASEIQKNRFFSVPEMKLLLLAAGFDGLHFYNGFTRKKDIDSHTWHIVAVAQKK